MLKQKACLHDRFSMERPAKYARRAAAAAALLNSRPQIKAVYDLGCGFCDLRSHLAGKIYAGFDLIARVPGVIEVDLNRELPPVPDRQGAAAVILGVLEYLEDARVLCLLRQALERFEYLLFSYHPADSGRLRDQRWRSALSRSQVMGSVAGWVLIAELALPQEECLWFGHAEAERNVPAGVA